jgi:hypothetical protein
MLAPGTLLGAYQILDLLGQGGMGEVYRARDTRLLREVALKVLPAGRASDGAALDRFASEARAASAINDPHLVAVYDVGQVGGVHFIVMELVEGGTLRDRLAGEGLPLPEALDLAGQIAFGLAAAHARNVVHRDLKPENVLIDREGRVKIADFGLAKLKQPVFAPPDAVTVGDSLPSGHRTDPNLLIGTISYMSPEQASGRLVDHRTDQFSFGVMLHEMLTGRRPFARATPAETLAAIIHDPPEPIEVVDAQAEGPLRWTLARCLAKDPAQRYDSTRDLARDVSQVHVEVTSSGARRSTLPRTRWSPMGRRAFALTAGAGLVGAGLLGAGLWARRRWREGPRFEKLTFERGTVWTGRFGPDGRAVVYAAAWNGEHFRLFRKEPDGPASTRVPVGDGSAAILSISRTGEMAVLVEPHVVLPGRLVGTLARVPLTGGAPRLILEEVGDADWGPNGDDIALVRHVNGLCVLEYPVGHRRYETAGWLSGPRVSPDGAYVAVFEHPLSIHDMGVVRLIGSDDNHEALGGVWTSSHGLAWSPDGDEVWVAASRGDGPNALFAIALSGSARLLERAPGTLTLLDVSPRGPALITRETRHLAIVLLTPDGRRHDLSVLDSSLLADLSSDGSTVLSTEFGEGGGLRHSVYLRRGVTGRPLRLGDGMAITLSPDGAWALAIVPGEQPRLVAYPTGTGEAWPIASDTVRYTHAASYFPDGRRLIVAGIPPGKGARLYVHDLHRGTARMLSDDPVFLGHMQGFPVSPDGRWAAAISPDRILTLYATADGTRRRFDAVPQGAFPLQWIDDGQGLLVARLADVPASVLRLDVQSGAVSAFREIPVEDPTGVPGFPCIRFSADGQTCAVTLARVLSELFNLTNVA